MPAWFPSLSQHLLLSTVALLVYVLSTRSRRERRAPAAAIAWVMGLALLPYLMLPLYLMFGQRKQKAGPRPPLQPPSPQSHWAAVLLESFGLSASGPVQVRFHADGSEARDALWSVIDSARDRLDLCTYLIGNDDFGRAALARLTERARAGVQVRLLLDGWGGLSAPRAALRALRAAGGKVTIFRPLFSTRRLGPRNLRNHRKLTIADGRRLWAGGRNLSAEYFTGRDGATQWIDLSFDLEGCVAASAAHQFDADWQAARGEGPIRAIGGAASFATEGPSAQFLPSGPDQAEDTAQALLIDACFHAQQRFLAVTPYFVPDGGFQT